MVTVTPKTLKAAIRYYSDPDVCQADLVAARWPDGVTCPTCGRKDVSYLATQRRWQCKTKHPRRQFSAKTGTIFEDSPLPLEQWFVAMWLLASCKNGVSSYEIHRAIGVSQKTAWFMLHRIRLAMQTGSFEKMSGEIEIDETFIGGKARNMHKAKRRAVMASVIPTTSYGRERSKPLANKVAVLGMLERCAFGPSRVHTMPVENVRKHKLQGEVRKHVEEGSEVFTDALHSYDGLKHDYEHEVVDHAECYAKGRVHTNGLESYWSLLKRALKGTYISVEPFHLFRYLDEQAFRFNERAGKDADRFAAVLSNVKDRRVMYKELIGKEKQPA